jgi:amino acid transporter
LIRVLPADRRFGVGRRNYLPGDCRTSRQTISSSSRRYSLPWAWEGARRIYAALLILLTAWALFAIHLGSVLQLFNVLGIVASPIMAIAAIQILRVNRRFLPSEFRPPRWREIVLLGSVVVYGGIAVALVWNLLPK